jgi:hypothetical protein
MLIRTTRCGGCPAGERRPRMGVDSSQWKNLPGGTTPPESGGDVRAFPAPPPQPGTAAATQRGCQVCGRGPADWFTARRHVGMLFLQRFVSAKVYMCSDHAQVVLKQFLGRTLAQGWWGIISFFVNIGVVAQDLSELRRAKKMAAPGDQQTASAA